jgi:hypothetical protein
MEGLSKQPTCKQRHANVPYICQNFKAAVLGLGPAKRPEETHLQQQHKSNGFDGTSARTAATAAETTACRLL